MINNLFLDQLVEFVHKYNEDTNGKEKILQRTKRKFENEVLELVAHKIAIDQVELSTILATLETYVNNVVSLFVKISDTSNFTKA